jgi:hypothetical protein
MKLLEELIRGCVDNNTDMATLLRYCLILASRLDNNEFQKWITNELTGYKILEDVPNYRILHVQNYGNFGNIARNMNNAIIPLGGFTDDEREFLEKAYIMESVGSLEHLLNNANSNGMMIPWPHDLVVKKANDIYTMMTCSSAWKVIPTNTFKQILDTIRTKVLQFGLELEKINQDLGSTTLSLNHDQKDEANKTIINIIHGDVGSIINDDHSSLLNINVKIGNIQSLIENLKQNNVPEQDIEDLRPILSEIQINEKKEWSDSLHKWLDNLILKASNGLWQISIDVAASVISSAINQYLGIVK